MKSKPYSQLTAFKAITKAAFRAITKSPSSVIFTIAFPLIFILVFGFIGGKGLQDIKVAFTHNTDTTSALAQEIKQQNNLKFVPYKDSVDLLTKIEKGRINVLIDLHNAPHLKVGQITLRGLPSSKKYLNQLQKDLTRMVAVKDTAVRSRMAKIVSVQQSIIQEKEFKSIDFILPGQLGFALLAASVFGTAFVFFNLRQGLVLKRFFATPVRRETILLGEGTARMFFQIIGALLIILIGYFFLDYTLTNGLITVINMLILSAIGVLIFMSFGFIISGLAKSESTVPPLANIISLPQFLLAGTFFPISDFPGWLQPIARILPLTYLNEALRAVAFEGKSLWGVRMDLGILLLWGIIGYFVAGRLFKWE